MKKTVSLLSFFLFFTLTLLFSLYSCRKYGNGISSAEKNKAITNPQVALDITLAKRYYKLLRKEKGINVTATHISSVAKRQAGDEVNTKHPIWEKASAGETAKSWYVEVPLFYNRRPVSLLTSKKSEPVLNERTIILNASFDRLVIYKNKQTGEVAERIVTYLPSLEYVNKHGKDISHNGIGRMDKDFSGFQLYRKWDGTLLFARQIENGKIVKRLKGINKQLRSNTGITASAREVCETYCTWSYEQTCYYSITEESITETCGAWELVATDCWQECYDDGDDGGGGPIGDPCIDYGDCGDDNGDDPPTNPDPCQQAQAGSAAATTLAGNSVYNTAKSNIMAAFANDGNEHGVSFGKDANGNIISSSISTGGTSNGTIPPISNQFADLHNHPLSNPPSSGDLYMFIDLAGNNQGYIRYIATPNGNVYALILTDPVAAANFKNLYPKVTNQGFEPTFPVDLVDEERDIRYGYGATEEMSFAFILSKYNAGVALLKQDTDGNFKRLNTEEHTDSNGSKTYTSNNCQ